MAIRPGTPAPPLSGRPVEGPRALFFFKVTCPVCALAAPVAEALERAYPGRIEGVGQDPPDALAAFAAEHGDTFPQGSDRPPYEASLAYGIRVVPTLVLVGPDGVVDDVVESWDREGYNRVSARLAELTGAAYAPVSAEGDGLPAFRPG